MVALSELLRWVNERVMLVVVVGRAATYLAHTTCQLHVLFKKKKNAYSLIWLPWVFVAALGLLCCACRVGDATLVAVGGFPIAGAAFVA